MLVFVRNSTMANRPKRVLVLGATGHIGQAVIRHALENGREVTAATRQSDPEALRGLGVKVVQIDGAFRSLADLAAGHDLLVDAAAPYPLAQGLPTGNRWRDLVDAAVRRMEVVIHAARRHGLRLAYVSSCTTLPRQEPPPAAAAALWRRSLSPYFEAKAAMEQTVVAAARAGLPAVIVNPAAFLGPWEYREVEGSFVRLVLERRLPMVVDQPMCVIDVRDVADAIDRALSLELYGRPIPLAGHNAPLPDLVVLTARLAGMPCVRPLPLDGRAVSAAAFWTQAAFTAFGLAPPPALGFIPLIVDVLPMHHSREQLALGVTIRPLDDTLRDAIAFHRLRQSN
jgi:dihydroflavonol-4-reductase